MDFRVLGTLELNLGDEPVHLGGPKQRALLAILLLRANEVVASDRLIDELWGNHAPASAQKALQVHVSQLRKALEPAGDVLATSAGGYVLRVGPGELDSARFEGMLDDASRAGDPATAVAALTAALDLWRGPALADFRYEPFAQAEAARLEDLRLDALERRIDARLALGQHAAAIGDVQSLVAREPLREHPRAQLMTALYRSGRQAEALEAYREARAALVEIGLTPGAELRELESAILNQDPSLHVAAPAADGAASDGRGDFVGREEELRRATGWIGDAIAGRGRLVLVGGEPGIGKSRLLAQLGDRAAARGVRVLWGRAWEAGGAPAYWPWLQALRGHVRETGADAVRTQLGGGAPYVAQVLPEVAELVPPSAAPVAFDSDGARVRLFDALSTFLANAAREQPLMLMLDDLHAADVPSLLLLQFLAGQLPDTRILVAGAYRDAAGGPGEALAATLVELSREPAVVRLSLSGLATGDVRRYIERTAGVDPPEMAVERIREDTAGNPLFVSELVRLLLAEGRLDDVADAHAPRVAIPEEVRQVIARRLNRLSDECRRVLTLASVLGRDFALDALGR
ncbi:MAG: BTAD domain-containing putative transcriptional regulator, partial [Gaiellaceae bacterium]